MLNSGRGRRTAIAVAAGILGLLVLAAIAALGTRWLMRPAAPALVRCAADDEDIVEVRVGEQRFVLPPGDCWSPWYMKPRNGYDIGVLSDGVFFLDLRFDDGTRLPEPVRTGPFDTVERSGELKKAMRFKSAGNRPVTLRVVVTSDKRR